MVYQAYRLTQDKPFEVFVREIKHHYALETDSAARIASRKATARSTHARTASIDIQGVGDRSAELVKIS